MTKLAEPGALSASDIALQVDFDTQLRLCMRKDVYRFKRRYHDCQALDGEKLTSTLTKLLLDVERSQARVKARQQALPKIT